MYSLTSTICIFVLPNKKWSICTQDTDKPHNVQWRHFANKKGNVQTTNTVSLLSSPTVPVS